MHDVLSGLEKSQKLMVFFCDLSKAFDCVSHDILLGKIDNELIILNRI